MRTTILPAVVLLSFCCEVPTAQSDEAQSATSHHAGHTSHAAASTEAPAVAFAASPCPPKEAAIRAEMTALGIIERCADIELLPNAGGFKVATYLTVDAVRASGKPVNGIAVETAPGRATFRIADRPELADYAICNLERSTRSEVPRSGRFKPEHGWIYNDARSASYWWDVKERVAHGATAPHLRVWAWFVTIPSANLAQGIERKWCRPTDELQALRPRAPATHEAAKHDAASHDPDHKIH